MAISIAYGLLFGTGMTLTFLPSLLVVANTIKFKFHNKFSKTKVTREEVEPAVKEENNLKKYI